MQLIFTDSHTELDGNNPLPRGKFHHEMRRGKDLVPATSKTLGEVKYRRVARIVKFRRGRLILLLSSSSNFQGLLRHVFCFSL